MVPERAEDAFGGVCESARNLKRTFRGERGGEMGLA
jgi:hypothetical protein